MKTLYKIGESLIWAIIGFSIDFMIFRFCSIIENDADMSHWDSLTQAAFGAPTLFIIIVFIMLLTRIWR